MPYFDSLFYFPIPMKAMLPQNKILCLKFHHFIGILYGFHSSLSIHTFIKFLLTLKSGTPNSDGCWRTPTFKRDPAEEETGKRLWGRTPTVGREVLLGSCDG